jgi:nitrogen fixation protein FixH
VRTGEEGGEVELALTDSGDRPVTDATVTVDFERPTFEGSDFAVDLSPTAPGRYRARFNRPLPGVWNLHATIRRGGDLFVHEQRIFLP